MIGSSIRGDNQMIYPLTYVFLLCMFFCVFTQLHFLALGLRFFDALYVVPVFQCFFISVSTLGGAGQWKEKGDSGCAVVWIARVAHSCNPVLSLSSVQPTSVNSARSRFSRSRSSRSVSS